MRQNRRIESHEKGPSLSHNTKLYPFSLPDTGGRRGHDPSEDTASVSSRQTLRGPDCVAEVTIRLRILQDQGNSCLALKCVRSLEFKIYRSYDV